MNKALAIAALAFALVACDKDNKPPVEQPPVVVSQPPATLPPVEKGVWCAHNEADFSPCNPAVKEIGSPCEPVGSKSVGCKSFICKKSCE